VIGGVTRLFGAGLNTLYTFVSSAWSPRTQLPQTVHGHAAVALTEDTALVCAGYRDGASQAGCNAYSATTDKWTEQPALNTARTCAGMVLYKGVFIILSRL
jgi:hypothetical protein